MQRRHSIPIRLGLLALMLGSATVISQACTLTDVVNLLGCRITRCWYKQQNGTWLVSAQAYNADGSYACGRTYTYVGTPGDAKDRNSLTFVFDNNGNNYLDCLEDDPPPFTNDGSCTLPPREGGERPPIDD